MSKDVKIDLGWGVGIVLLALASTYARQQGLIDADTVQRIVMGAIGLMVAWFGNRLPKKMVPNAGSRRATRFAGWSMALSGLVYAGLFAFAPMTVATIGGTAAIATGLIATVAYCFWLRSRTRVSA